MNLTVKLSEHSNNDVTGQIEWDIIDKMRFKLPNRNRKDNYSNRATFRVQTKVFGGNKKKNKRKRPEKTPRSANFSFSIDPEKMLRSFNHYMSEDQTEISMAEASFEIPESISGKYKWDYNIFKIHDIIQRIFKHDIETKIPELEIELQQLKRKARQPLTVIQQKSLYRKISAKEQQIQSIVTNKRKSDYLTQAQPLLQGYRKLGPLVQTKIIGNKEDNQQVESKSNQLLRHKIINEYFEIARKYIRIDLIRVFSEEDCCSNCRIVFSEENVEKDSRGIIMCKNCGVERMPLTRSPFCNNATRVNTSRNNYDDRENFIKAIQRFQGLQVNKPDTTVYEKLDRYFESIGFISAKEIRKQSVNEIGMKDGTNKKLMYDALRKTGQSKQYDNIQLILHEYWGYKLHDISHLEDLILRDYDISQPIYESIIKDRKSSLNSQFRLYKHLKLLDYGCYESDFKIPTTPEIREFHEEMWSMICERVGW